MPTKRTDNRSRLVEAADRLVHQYGFNQTTLADIAEKAKVPLGNVYYYFKTKEEIGEALIDHRAGFYGSLLKSWDDLPNPRKRILTFINTVADNREALAQSGCPIGSLCQELHKEGGSLADRAAGMFTAILGWLEEQFRLLGTGRESSNHALHLLSALQGASLLSNTFNDPKLMLREASRLKQWIDAL